MKFNLNIPFLTPALGYIISFLYNLTHNYLFALILFAIFIKLILFPLGIKQQRNSVKQASLRPKEMAIRKKYAGRTDEATKKKLNEEIMKLYQEEKFNPAAGCLPLLIQLPILYSLYYVITNPLQYIQKIPIETINKFKELAHTLKFVKTNRSNDIDLIKAVLYDGNAAKFNDLFHKYSNTISLDKMKDLQESFNLFGINLLDVPQVKMDLLIIIPILTFVFAFASTKIIRKFTYQPAPDQAKTMAFMDWTMPLFSVWISFQVSAAVGIYWMAQNILGAVQQLVLYKMYPIGQITEEQIKEAELQLKGKATKKESDSDDTPLPAIEKAPLKKGKKKPKSALSVTIRKKGVSPKVKKLVKEGKRFKARRKI